MNAFLRMMQAILGFCIFFVARITIDAANNTTGDVDASAISIVWWTGVVFACIGAMLFFNAFRSRRA